MLPILFLLVDRMLHSLLHVSCTWCPARSFADDASSQLEHAYEVAGADGFDSLRGEAYMVNGQMTQANPWAANNVLDTRKYKLAQERLKAAREAAAAAGESDSS